GVKAGDRVAIYMGMVPEVVVAMLACARIGAPHTVVFGGFAADALRDRIQDCGAKALITQDMSFRRGHEVKLWEAARAAVLQCPPIESVIVQLRRPDRLLLDDGAFAAHFALDPAGHHPDLKAKVVRFYAKDDRALKEIEPVAVAAEHPLFVLYTSGSTGKP